MPRVDCFDIRGTKVGDVELNDGIFGVEVNKDAIHQYVVNYLANQRQGTQSALTRTEVRGGGRKPWRQKGTGRARQGSRRSPQWAGGGVVFAPKPREYRFAINKKLKRLALKSVLTSKVQEGALIIVDDIKLDTFKTKEAIAIAKALKFENGLFVTDGVNKNLVISAGNLPGVDTAIVTAMNAYDILKHDKLILTKAAVGKIEEVYA